MDSLKDVGVGGGAGLIGAILSWLGFRHRIKRIEEDMNGLKKRVRFTDVCKEIVERMEGRLKRIEAMQDATSKDIKELLKLGRIRNDAIPKV